MPNPEELFGVDLTPQPAVITDPVNPAPVPTLTVPAEVAALIGEGKKYATVEAALASIPNAQSHISTLEGENAEFKSKLMSNDKLDQVLARLDTPTTVQPATPTSVEPSVSREDLSQLVQQEIAQTTKVNLEEANLVGVKSKLQESYGDTAGERWSTKAAEAGMTTAQLTALAKVAPQAVLKLVGETKPGTLQPQPTSPGANLTTVGDIGEPPVKKNIMMGASTKEIVNEWRACAPTEED